MQKVRMSTAHHALYHVTSWLGVKNNYIVGISDPYLPIRYATFMVLR